MEPLPVALKVNVEIEANGQPLRITAQVEGEGEAAKQAAAEIAYAVAAVLAKASSGTPAMQVAPAPATEPESAHDTQLTALTAEASLERSVTDDSPQPSPTPSMIWLQRNRPRINLGFGALLLALAMLVPLIVPPDQRREVLIMTILFGLTGTLLLFTALLPGRSGNAKVDEPQPSAADKTTRVSSGNANVERRVEKLRTSNKADNGKPLKAGWGVAFGVAFVLAGLLAPFVLGAITADERFVIMLGFAPVTVVGFFMIAIFGRGLLGKPQPILTKPNLATSKPASAGIAKRAPVSRVPQNFEYRAIVPVAIVGLLILMIVVVALVIFATAASVAR